jgi:hypothetical protein
MKRIITNSMRTTFLDCPYKCFCEYVRRLTPKREASYFRWGSLVHAGAHCRDLDQPVQNAIIEAREDAMKRCLPVDELQEVDEMCDLLPAAMDAHLLRWHKDDENYEMLGGEESGGKFSLELPCGWLFQGKIDKIIRDVRTGKQLTLERKTAKNPNDDYFEDILLDSQPKGYLLAAQRCFGFETRDVLYDLYGKPGIKHKQWQTRDMYIEELKGKYLLDREKLFLRRRMPFDQEAIDAYYWEIDQVAQMMQWCLEEAIWPKHHARNRIGGCAYKPICLRGDESKFYVRPLKAFNPELV